VPVLAGVLIEAQDDGTVTLSAFDYEVSAKVTIAADVTESGTVLVLGRLLADICRNLPSRPQATLTELGKIRLPATRCGADALEPVEQGLNGQGGTGRFAAQGFNRVRLMRRLPGAQAGIARRPAHFCDDVAQGAGQAQFAGVRRSLEFKSGKEGLRRTLAPVFNSRRAASGQQVGSKRQKEEEAPRGIHGFT
jgi:hypothetical protein